MIQRYEPGAGVEPTLLTCVSVQRYTSPANEYREKIVFGYLLAEKFQNES